MPALEPAAAVSNAVTTASQEQSLSETASAGDSKVDDRVRPPTELVVSDALVMIEGSRIPLLVFVNSRSGGQQGKPLLAQFSSWLRPEQVIDLATTKPEDALRRFAAVDELRVLVSGGDGTCGWLMTAMENVGCNFPLATMPLGTGNDLARTLRWGHGLTASMRREQWLHRVAQANIVGLDRWCASPPGQGLRIRGRGSRDEGSGTRAAGARAAGARARLASEPLPSNPNPTRRVRLYDCKEPVTGLPPTFVAGPQTPASAASSSAASTAPPASTAREYNGVFNNYFGLGIEAHGIYAFHKAREANPARFSGRLKNQALMGALGLPTTGLCGCCCPAPQLKPRLKLSVRRATAQGGAGAAHISPWEEVELPSRLKAIILINIPSHSAGANPWGSARSAVPQDYADGIIEVVGAVNALHGIAYLSLNKVLRLRRGPGCFKRLAQAAEVRLELLEPLHVQVDGEPWLQPAGTFAISCTGKSNVRPLAASAQPALPRAQQL